MPRAWSLFIVLLLLPGLSLFADDDFYPDDDPPVIPIESDWYDFHIELYARGDRTFNISVGALVPAFFAGELDGNRHGLSPGGTGSLAFNYFLNQNIFVGGKLSGMFAATRLSNMLFIIPIGAQVGYQLLFGRFEVPITLMIGGALQRYLEKEHFGLIVQPGASFFWRFNPDWSFGFNANWWFVPQWPRPGADGIRRTVFGNFLELTMSARYHF